MNCIMTKPVFGHNLAAYTKARAQLFKTNDIIS